MKKNLELDKVAQIMGTGPVVMISTEIKGKKNVMTLAWNMMVDFNPPLIAIVVSDESFTHRVLKKSKECVVNIPPSSILNKVISCGRVSGKDIDKFKEFDLTPILASTVKAPLVKECAYHFECKVIDLKMAKKYNLFILKVTKAWSDTQLKKAKTIHHLGGKHFFEPGKVLTK